MRKHSWQLKSPQLFDILWHPLLAFCIWDCFSILYIFSRSECFFAKWNAHAKAGCFNGMHHAIRTVLNELLINTKLAFDINLILGNPFYCDSTILRKLFSSNQLVWNDVLLIKWIIIIVYSLNGCHRSAKYR